VSKRHAAGETVIVEVARSDSLVIAELPPSGVAGDVELVPASDYHRPVRRSRLFRGCLASRCDHPRQQDVIARLSVATAGHDQSRSYMMARWPL
jgi:hypothetical protein